MDDRTQQTLDDLAELFLTGKHEPLRAVNSQEREAPADASASPPSLEAVLLGNLPGMAHVWLTQYAQHRAEREGPVLLLTVDRDTQTPQGPGRIEAELIQPRDRGGDRGVGRAAGDGPRGWAASASSGSSGSSGERQDAGLRLTESGGAVGERPSQAASAEHRDDALLDQLLGFEGTQATVARPHPGASPVPRLDRLLAQHLATDAPADERVAAVVVYADAEPAEIDRLLDVDRWTVLTGADPTAVAAASAMLGRLAEADPQAPQAKVGVFVVGSPEDKSRQASAQIAEDARRWFDAPIQTRGSLQRMRPASVRSLGPYPGLDDQWRRLLQTLDDVEAVGAASDAAAIPLREPVKTVRPQIQPERLADFLDQTGMRDRQTEPPSQPQPIPDTQAAPDAQAAAAPAPASAPTSQAPESHDDQRADAIDSGAPGAEAPDLPALLTAAFPAMALKPLPVRSPDHPAFDLAFDGGGRLHVLGVLDDAEHPRATLLELDDAQRWADKHAALLRCAAGMLDQAQAQAQAQAQTQTQTQTPKPAPTVHLFTRHAERVLPLAAELTDKFGPEVRLHLLQRLPLAAGPTWLATPLQPDLV